MSLIRHLLIASVVASVLMPLGGCDSSDPSVYGGPVAMRRLTPEQYGNVVHDAFSSAIDVSGRFEPDSRRSGLNAIGTSLVAVTPSGFEQYEALARNIAAQVVAPERRETILPCEPSSADAVDDACAEQIIASYGRQLLRRPLEAEEIALRVKLASTRTVSSGDFYAGIELVLSSLLVAPDFLFRVDIAELAPLEDQPKRMQLTDLSLASRLSFFLWNRGPDDELLTAAERGALSKPEQLNSQVERMLASEHLAGGARAFFDDLFLFDQFDELSKDVDHYPLYNARLAADAREQTLRFVVDHLVEQRADYRTLFTSSQLPMTRSLGPIYGLPVLVAEGWETTQLPANHSRSGLLAQASFSMLHAHPGRSSPTLRGVFMREALLCQTIPEAPADVDFTQFVQDQASEHKTARDRLQVHSTEASCNKCHRLTDPIGLGLEVFDGIGRYRTTENGATIDTRSDFDGRDFANPVEMGQAFAESPLVGACLVENLYRYAVGREQNNRERPLLRHLEKSFEASGFVLGELMRDIATSEGFRTAAAPKTMTVAANENIAASGEGS